ncbi:hypothetical protein JHK85_044886 [Glycine max]|nr:hypothetical protein JHK85_044886 [Glycine max]
MSLSLFFLLILIFSSSTSSSTTIILQGNTTLKSPNNTFQLGLFSFSFSFYLAIRHTSLPFPNTTWVANRLHPSPTQTGSILHLTQTGSLILTHSNTTLWSTAPTFNTSSNLSLKLLDSGNLILSAPNGLVLWQSFDSPTDTWLPGMNLTRFNSLTSWRTQTDPTPGLYSLLLKPPFFGEFELVFNDTVSYWSTGNWTDGKFLNIPEMSIPYLYSFHFLSPFSPAAEFGFSERASETGTQPPTMFRVEPFGQIRQYTWNNQAGSWKMFWSMPEPVCQVRGLCGRFGVCIGETSKLCECVSGFEPLDGDGWGSGDYSKGCYRGDAGCDGSDGFRDLGDVRFGFGNVSLIKGKSRSFCEGECLRDCGCVGLSFDEGSGVCRNFYGLLSDFQNLTGGGESGGFYVRVPKGGSGRRKKVFDRKVLSGVVIGVVVVLGVVVMTLLVMVKKKRGGGGGGGESGDEMGGKWFFPPWAAQRIIEGNVSDVMDKRLGNAYNIEEARRVALVAVWCIQDDEAMRPTMGMVVKMLEGLVEVSVPPPPKLLQALVTGDSFHGVKADSGNGASSTGGSLSDGDLEVSTADSESYTGNVFSPLDVNVNVSVR